MEISVNEEYTWSYWSRVVNLANLQKYPKVQHQWEIDMWCLWCRRSHVLSFQLIQLRIAQIYRRIIVTNITSALSSKSPQIPWLSSSISFVDISFRLWVTADVVLGPAKLNTSVIFVIFFNSSSFFYFFFFVSQFLFLDTTYYLTSATYFDSPSTLILTGLTSKILK